MFQVLIIQCNSYLFAHSKMVKHFFLPIDETLSEVTFLYGKKPLNSSQWLFYAYVDVSFSRCDIATQV